MFSPGIASESITETGCPATESDAALASACTRLNSFLGRLSKTVIQVPAGSDITAVLVGVGMGCWLVGRTLPADPEAVPVPVAVRFVTGEGRADAARLWTGVGTTSTGFWGRNT